MLIKLLPFLIVKFINVGCKFVIAYFVSFLVLPVVRKILLHCIVSQMYRSVIISKRVLAGGSTDISIFVPIAFYTAIDAGYHYIMADIEFAFVIEKRPLDVGLDYIGSVGSISVLFPLLEYSLYVLQIQAHFDAVTSVTILPWLHNPSIILLSFRFILIVFSDLFGSFMIIPQKLKIFLILKSILNMEGQRQEIKYLQLQFFVIIGHCIKQSFFITNDVVIYQMVVHFQLFYLVAFDVFFIFEYFGSREQSFIIVLFVIKINIKVFLILFIIYVSQNRLILIFSYLQLLPKTLPNSRLLYLEVIQNFYLTPYEISLLNSICETIPGSASDKPTHHAGIVALTYKYFQTVLVFNWNLNIQRIGIIGFPKQIAVVISLKRDVKLPS